MSPHSTAPTGADSALFTPLKINNGNITLSHRIVHAPLTRNRGVSLDALAPATAPNHIWYPDALQALYYSERTTPGTLLISEALPVSLQAGAYPGMPGIFHPSQTRGWKPVVDAVHAKGGFMYAQLWHGGRAGVPAGAGVRTVSASATGFAEEPGLDGLPLPEELSAEGIRGVIADFVGAARGALELGFDGVEVHAGNGYLVEQFLSSNVNVRGDAYGGSPEKRCRFALELMEALKEAVGEERLAIRLSPFGLFNEARGMQRVETWGYLCRELKRRMNLSYVHFIEPRYEQVFSVADKDKFLESWGLGDVTLDMFTEIFGDTPFFSAGGFNDKNCWGVIESGSYDALVIGRYFLSTPDLVERLKLGRPFNKYDRSRFYGPFEEREIGYTDYKAWEKPEETRE